MSRAFSRTIQIAAGALAVSALPALAQNVAPSAFSSATPATSNAVGAPVMALSAAAASKNSGSYFAISGAIGLALPTASGLSIGPDLQAAGEGWFEALDPIGLRFEIGYDHFGSSGNTSEGVIRFLIDAVYDFKTSSKVQPYILGGLGLYSASLSYSCPLQDAGYCNNLGGGSDTNFGFNLGGGIRFPFSSGNPDFQGYAELRFHDILASDGTAVFPLQVGVRYVLR